MTTTLKNTASGTELLDQVQAALERYVILPTIEHTHAVTLWIAATHAAQAWNTAPRLVIRAPEKRCGKSRLLDITEALSHRPVMTINASPSAIYRMIGLADGDPPTILIDEADTIFGKDATHNNEDLRGLLNAGHQRNRPALRYDASTRTIEHIDTYAMAALAGIGRMPDTIEDRAIIIPMRRRAPNEHVNPYRLRRDAPPLHTLRTQLCNWTRQHINTLKHATPQTPLEDRAADTWEALFATADLTTGPWPQQARHAATTLTKAASADNQDTLRTQLLADTKTILTHRNTIFTEDLVRELCEDPEAPWATHGHNGLTPRTLGLMLNDFDIKSSNIRHGDKQRKGYTTSDFTDAFARYLPTPQPNPDNVINLPTTPKHPSQASQASQHPQNPHKH